MEYFNLITYAESCTLIVKKYDLSDVDYFGVLRGKRYEGPPIANAKLYVKGEHSDLVGGPLSWLICSDRLTELFNNKSPLDFEIFEAPLFDENDRKVSGYKIINPIRRIECLDIDKSVYLGTKEKIRVVTEWAILRKKIPNNVHMFKVDESPYAVFITDELFENLKGKGLKGIGFFAIRLYRNITFCWLGRAKTARPTSTPLADNY